MQLTYQTLEDSFICSEITVKQYKNLLKSFYGDDINPLLFVDSFIELLSALSNKPQIYFKQLNLLDLFLILLQMRIYTLGNACQIVFKNSKENQTQQTVHLNLEKIKQDLMLYWEFHFPCNIQNESVCLNISFPSLSNLNYYNNPSAYIKNCTLIINNEKTSIENLSIQDAAKLLDSLPVELSYKIFSIHKKLIDDLNDLNFLTDYNLEKDYFLGFDLTPEMFLWYVKLFFSETLDVFYDNLFYLSKIGNLNLAYVENDCTPGEYIFYIKRVQEFLSKQAEAQKQVDQPFMNTASSGSLNGM